MMVKRFRKEWKPDRLSGRAVWVSRRGRLLLSQSLVETEAKLNEDRSRIASVIYNRSKAMPLAVDSTIITPRSLKENGATTARFTRATSIAVRLTTPVCIRACHLDQSPPRARVRLTQHYPRANDYLYYVREPSRNDGPTISTAMKAVLQRASGRCELEQQRMRRIRGELAQAEPRA